ncbi:hypothetical protein [Streptomyces niveus]|uniref:hypothetical protein n=1 Tax=Streptomyces niveus TaxID=193462 RepID=UPI0036D24598
MASEIAWGMNMLNPRYPEAFPPEWDAGQPRDFLDFALTELVKSLEAPGDGPFPQSGLETAHRVRLQ